MGTTLVLELTDQNQYYIKLSNGDIVYKSKKYGQESKNDCLYFIYMNSDCVYRFKHSHKLDIEK